MDIPFKQYEIGNALNKWRQNKTRELKEKYKCKNTDIKIIIKKTYEDLLVTSPYCLRITELQNYIQIEHSRVKTTMYQQDYYIFVSKEAYVKQIALECGLEVIEV